MVSVSAEAILHPQFSAYTVPSRANSYVYNLTMCECLFIAVRIGTLYVISGVGGSLLSALFMVSNISVGASGALFGLLGSMLSELITNWTIYENKAGS